MNGPEWPMSATVDNTELGSLTWLKGFCLEWMLGKMYQQEQSPKQVRNF